MQAKNAKEYKKFSKLGKKIKKYIGIEKMRAENAEKSSLKFIFIL